MLSYINGSLHVENVSLRSVANSVCTPVYVYSSSAFASRYHEFEVELTDLDYLICYAMKANSNQAILKLLANLGAGFDAVSGGEIARALSVGVQGEKIVFSGVGKTHKEMKAALKAGVRHINVESEVELARLNEVAISMGKVAPVAVRVNPDIDAKTHSKIATGKAENKFGVPKARIREVYQQAAAMSGIQIVGLDIHIGSQLTELAPYQSAFRVVRDLVLILRADGHEITRLDLGGGLGISYGNECNPPLTPAEYCAAIREHMVGLDCEIEIEPGRYIAGCSGVLLTEVIYIKQGQGRSFIVVDAAMNDLIRPAMYDAWHKITPITEPNAHQTQYEYDIVGPVCESSDTFAVKRSLPLIEQGNLLVVEAAGAYGAVMASEYNTRPMVPEVLVKQDNFAVIRERPTIDEIINRDKVPAWL